MSSSRFQVVGTILSTFALGCSDGLSTSLYDQAPAAEFVSGSTESSNVFRFKDQLVFAMGDSETDLLVWFGLPENPADAIECGGTEPFDLAQFQIVGDPSGALILLAQGQGNVHVYQLSTFTDFCSSVPLGQGTGRIVLNDNDLDVTGTRTNSFGGRIQGTVTLADGGTAQVIGDFRFLIGKDDIRRDIVNAVRMTQ